MLSCLGPNGASQASAPLLAVRGGGYPITHVGHGHQGESHPARPLASAPVRQGGGSAPGLGKDAETMDSPSTGRLGGGVVMPQPPADEHDPLASLTETVIGCRMGQTIHRGVAKTPASQRGPQSVQRGNPWAPRRPPKRPGHG
jgi:hypothetical protein